ncbi:TolC family outer membrane protein [Desulfobulbus rhabdoformis]|uniref:TolC family outer membrane protein n=1 Tax=Desulfobulbus rhabdoformis TaxID=34032 RepID=UPI003B82CA82
MSVLFILFILHFSFGKGLAATILDIYSMSKDNDPILQAAHAKHQATQEQRSQAIAQMLPTISASGQTGRIFQDIHSSDNAVYGIGETDYQSTTLSLTLTQPLFHWELITGLQQAKAEILRSEAEYRLAEQELILRVAERYLQVLAAQDMQTFVQAEQSAVHQHYELARQQFKKGLIPITDLHDAKARKATVDAQVIEAQNLLDDAHQGIWEITGQDIGTLNPLHSVIPLQGPQPVDMETWIKAAQSQNMALRLRKYAVEVAGKEVSRLQAGHYPTVDLVGTYEDEDTEGSLYGGGSELATSEIMVKVNIPIFQGGMVSSRVRAAKQNQTVARQELIREERQVLRKTRRAFLGVQTALSKVEALKQSVESNKLALQAKQRGYLSGLYDSLSVLDAERDLSMTQQEYAKARYEYLLNGLMLKQSTDNLSLRELEQLAQLFE